MNDLILEGCTPEPLMGYLKALGVLRLVTEQADPEARGSWRDGVFVLETSLDGAKLSEFFLDHYKPTPLLAPWNGGSGFYVKLDLDKFLESAGKEIEFKGREAVDSIDNVEKSDVERLSQYREQIRETKRALAAVAEEVEFAKALAEPLRLWPQATSQAAKKRVKDEATKILNLMLLFRSGQFTFSIGKAAKDEFISDLRGKVLTDDGLSWLDAALAMRTGQKKNRVEAPTLGSGGNIGNSDFSARFAQLIAKVMPLKRNDQIAPASARLLNASLFGTPSPHLHKMSVDQFDPGKAGGANGTQGMEAAPSLNPWDYVLMLEGSLALAGNTSRRLGTGRVTASFPFVVESTPAGHGSVGSDNTRGETWLPLWSCPSLYGEIKYLLSEGRAEVGRVRARSGLNFAQAVASLGVDRGIESFVRYEFQERLGQSYIATPVGRFQVPRLPLDGIELVRALNDWLDSFRFACRTKSEGAKTEPPPRFPTALRRIESAIFEFCKFGGVERLVGIIGALGNAERELAVGDVKPDNRRTSRPLGRLASGWLKAANDGSPEFRLARSVAFLKKGTKGVGRIRRNLEPVEAKGAAWAWGEGGGHVVWNGGDLARNLGAIVARRMLESEKEGEPFPPFDSPFPAPLADISAFLHREIDETKLDDLIWGLSLVECDNKPVECDNEPAFPKSLLEQSVPRAYAILKLTLLPGTLEWAKAPNGEPVLRLHRPNAGNDRIGTVMKSEPAIPAKLRAGDVQGACEIAARRLRASGFEPLRGFLPEMNYRATDATFSGVAADRFLGALLFPIPNDTVNQLADLVLRRPSAESLV